MQKYPGGGYKEHYYQEEIVEDYSFQDDFHYNKGSSGIHMMKPGGHCSPEKPKHNYMNHNVHGYEYDNNCDNLNKGHDAYTFHSEKPKHNYMNHNVHGYEYDNNCDNLNKGRDGYTFQHVEARIEKEQYTEPFNRRSEYSAGHGGKHHMDAHKYQSSAPVHGHFGGYAGGGHGGHHTSGGGGFLGGHHGGGGFLGGNHGIHNTPEKSYWNSRAITD